jgi:hypothetical protein
MQDDTYTVPAYHAEHGRHSVSLVVRELDDDFLLSFKLPTSDELLTCQASDCFAALQGIRRKAEGRGWRICCMGSRKNVWPSAMSRDMGGGFKAYVLTLGQQGRTETMVEILVPDEPDSYCSVAEQEAFASQWFDSLDK